MSARDNDFTEPPNGHGLAGSGLPALAACSRRHGVLVVDDEHMVRVMLQMGLERNGFEVWSAGSGREAIELYREHREDIALILLDIRMPNLDGPQTLDALRELDLDVPTGFMFADPAEYEAEDLLGRGATYLIPKPFRLEELLNILRPLACGESHRIQTAGGECRE